METKKEVVEMYFESNGEVVALIGDIIYDSFCVIKLQGQSAEDGNAQRFEILNERNLPGGVGCTARCVKALGGDPEIYAVTGVGSTARRLRNLLRDAGIRDATLAQVEGRCTTLKIRYIDEHTGRHVMEPEWVRRDPIPERARETLLGALRATKAKVLLVSDYGRGVLTPEMALEISGFSRNHGKFLIVDGRERPLEWYQTNFPHLDLITPNKREAEAMVGRPLRTENNIEQAGREIREALGCSVLLKLSERGAKLFLSKKYSAPESSGEPNGTAFRVEPGAEYSYAAHNEHVVCVSGAGDTFASTIALCVATGNTLPYACEIGSRAAAITVGKPGSEVANREELDAVLKALRDNGATDPHAEG